MLFYILSFWSVGIAFLCALYVSRTIRERREPAGGRYAETHSAPPPVGGGMN